MTLPVNESAVTAVLSTWRLVQTISVSQHTVLPHLIMVVPTVKLNNGKDFPILGIGTY